MNYKENKHPQCENKKRSINLNNSINMKKLLQLVMVSLICASCGHTGGNVDYGLIPVKTGERYGYINLKGEYIINPQFNSMICVEMVISAYQILEYKSRPLIISLF